MLMYWWLQARMGHKKLKSETIIMDHDHVLEGASRLMERRKGSSAPTSPEEYDPFDSTDSSSTNAPTGEIIISVVIRHLIVLAVQDLHLVSKLNGKASRHLAME